ncbi:hypothetical protein GE061_005463 [Apolygus lucorum]|uniref:Phorbol-ester/DAG-type domain-containing protein n=1 Tax=Apolygus lucorum TaxID=248454 RepID=A0A8S9WYZ3_APOLU|nr:hypothetical protein GE061_005463 [Apolygus lucorum]
MLEVINSLTNGLKHVLNVILIFNCRNCGTICQVCKKGLPRRIGKQGYECRDCQHRCHKHCHVKVETTCPNSNIHSLELCTDPQSPYAVRKLLVLGKAAS